MGGMSTRTSIYGPYPGPYIPGKPDIKKEWRQGTSIKNYLERLITSPSTYTTYLPPQDMFSSGHNKHIQTSVASSGFGKMFYPQEVDSLTS